jgi:hypothetical protein
MMLCTVYGVPRVMSQYNRGAHAHAQALEHPHWSETVNRASVRVKPPPERAAAGRCKRRVLRDLANHLATKNPQKDQTA